VPLFSHPVPSVCFRTVPGAGVRLGHVELLARGLQMGRHSVTKTGEACCRYSLETRSSTNASAQNLHRAPGWSFSRIALPLDRLSEAQPDANQYLSATRRAPWMIQVRYPHASCIASVCAAPQLVFTTFYIAAGHCTQSHRASTKAPEHLPPAQFHTSSHSKPPKWSSDLSSLPGERPSSSTPPWQLHATEHRTVINID
jgi:hypothetical protein